MSFKSSPRLLVLFAFILATVLTGLSQVSNSLVSNVWQLSVKGKAVGLKDDGSAFVTFSTDGTFSGYGLSTLSGGMFTLSGTWALGPSGKITGSFNESPLSISGNVTGKASTKALALRVATTEGNYTLNGKPVSVANLPNFAGSWNISLTAPRTHIRSDLSISPMSGHPGLFEIAGGPQDGYGISGQAVETVTGGLTMYISSVSLGDSAALIGKFNVGSQKANLNGKDESNYRVGVKLTRP
jgi:hypothetical protein